MDNKAKIMKELIDRYEQLESVKGSPMAREELEYYIKNLENELKGLL